MVPLSVCAAELHGRGGRGSGLLRLQRGSELLHEQEEESPERSDVHRPVQQVPGEFGCTSGVSSGRRGERRRH